MKHGKMMRKIVLMTLFAMASVMVFADITVSDVEVFSGSPWKEVVVGYTITGTNAWVDVIKLTATDKTANRTYTAKTLQGAELSEGRHVMRWNALADGVKFSSSDVVFAVSAVELDYVQLWANGPYWAKCNVGATKPEEYGYYFWWGDTVGYKRNSDDNGWVSVKNGTSFSFDSDNCCPTDGRSESSLKSAGYIDSTGNLVAKYDAATAYLGSPWRMPTDAELNALTNNCDTSTTTRNGVPGLLVTGKGAFASKRIFLPAAGIGLQSRKDGLAYDGCYWSSTPDLASYWDDAAWCLRFHYSPAYLRSGGRFWGLPVRPVRGTAQ